MTETQLKRYVGKKVQITFIDGYTIKDILRELDPAIQGCNYGFMKEGKIYPVNLNKVREMKVW